MQNLPCSSRFVRNALAALCLAGTALHATSATRYQLIDLGLAGAYSQSFSYGLSDNGQYVVGWVQQGTNTQGFRWSSAAGMELLPMGASASASRAFGVNDAGVAVGETAFAANVRGATLWAPGAAAQALGTLPDPGALGYSSVAFGINNAGAVAGWSDSVDNTRAFRWSGAAGMESVGVLPGGTQTRAYSIAADSSIVGWGTTAAGDRGFVANPALVSVGTVSGATGSRTRGFGVSSNAAWIAGDARDASIGEEAFAWSETTGLLTLGKLAGATSSFGADINREGFAVGWNQGGAQGDEAYLWTPAGGMQSLNSLLVGSSGWWLQRARAINDSGMIVANAVDANGNVRAVLLTAVPEPTSAALVMLALAALASASNTRRRKQG